MTDVFAHYQAALRRGHQFAAERRYREALAHYQEAAGVAGERALPHTLVGSMLVRLGNAREALAAYDRALAIDPTDLDALSGRTAALLAAGRRSEAAALQKQIADLRDSPAAAVPTPTGLHTPATRTEMLAVAGEEARDGGDSAAAVDAWLAEAREHAAESHFDASLDAALRALAIDTGSPRVHVELARIYAQRGWRREATDHVAALRRLLELSPDDQAARSLDDLASHLSGAQAGPPPA